LLFTHAIINAAFVTKDPQLSLYESCSAIKLASSSIEYRISLILPHSDPALP